MLLHRRLALTSVCQVASYSANLSYQSNAATIQTGIKLGKATGNTAHNGYREVTDPSWCTSDIKQDYQIRTV